MVRKIALYAILLISLLSLCTSCDIRGANDPYSYAPQTSHSIWEPPAKAQRRLIYQDLEREVEDYEQFSKESPLTLAEIIDIALTRNPETKESWALARVSAAEYGQSLKDYFILADVSGDFTRTRFSDFTGPQRAILYETQYGAELELTYRILDFGQTRMSAQAALQSLFNADWSHNSQIQKTIQLMMTDYYDYLYQKQLLFSSEQDVINAKVSLDATEEKFRQGLADVSDIVQAKTSYLQQKLAVVNQKQTLHSSYTQLVSNMGLPADSAYYFEEYPEEMVTFDLETLDKLIVKANKNRPDLFAAEAAVKSNDATYIAARLSKFPVLTGEFDIGRRYYQHGLNDTYNFKAQVNLTFPLFQGFFLDNTIKVARANLVDAEAELEQVRLSIIQEVSNYRSDVSYSQESIDYATQYLASAEEDFKVNLRKYKVGTGTIVSLINAQTAVADARSQLSKALNSWYTSIANLAYATGILLPKSNREPLHEKTLF
ncbi:MAG: Outer membrane protein TolC [Chlamydiae bacterium]|nr:Outer membrane protein TolC [Chlamydiota bacterium]